MATKNMAYDHPAYLARLSHAFPALAAGANGATSKFVAFANMMVYGVVASLVTAGTSTSTLYNGTATVTNINGDSFSLVRVMNNAAPGVAPSLSTATYGPFALSLYNGTATGTQTNAAGVTVVVPVNGTATTGQAQAGAGASPFTGGVAVNQGDQLYILRGTDATAVSGFSLDYAVTPLASVTA